MQDLFEGTSGAQPRGATSDRGKRVVGLPAAGTTVGPAVEPYEGTSVYVVTEGGVLEGDEYAFLVERALYGGPSAAGDGAAGDGTDVRGVDVALSKESR